MENLLICRDTSLQSVSPISAKFSLYFPSHSSRHSSLKAGQRLYGLISENLLRLKVKRSKTIQSKTNVLRVSAIQEIQARNDDRRMFIFGMGFVGQYLAEQLKHKGWSVLGTCTSEAKKKELKEKGYEAFIFKAGDEMKRFTLTSFKALSNVTHIISCIPPIVGFEEDPVLFQHGELLRDALSSQNICWMGYLSSTRVYGHWDGDWVDEDSPARPVDKVALARLEAEKAWMALGHNTGIPVQIFRLGGIYGFGRSAIDTIIRQRTLSMSQKTRVSRHYTSRVHVADICQAILASIELPSSGKIYNVVDDDPAPRAEVFFFAKSLLAKRWPSEQWESKETETLTGDTSGILNNYTDIAEKRVSNKRLKDELKVKLLYPSYRLGLESIIESIDKCSL